MQYLWDDTSAGSSASEARLFGNIFKHASMKDLSSSCIVTLPTSHRQVAQSAACSQRFQWAPASYKMWLYYIAQGTAHICQPSLSAPLFPEDHRGGPALECHCGFFFFNEKRHVFVSGVAGTRADNAMSFSLICCISIKTDASTDVSSKFLWMTWKLFFLMYFAECLSDRWIKLPEL